MPPPPPLTAPPSAPPTEEERLEEAPFGQMDEPPFIEDLQPENVLVLCGQPFELHAQYVGWPEPEVTWLRGKKELVAGIGGKWI